MDARRRRPLHPNLYRFPALGSEDSSLLNPKCSSRADARRPEQLNERNWIELGTGTRDIQRSVCVA